MTPEKALELVGKYARLTKGIKSATSAIGEHLDLCRGWSGKRKDPFNSCDNASDPRFAMDKKNRELDLHLVSWYTPEREDFGGQSWIDIDDECKEQCPHCYVAHEVIQLRKGFKAQLGHVKRSMTRSES